MSYDPDKHHRRSIRLQGYDYSQSGAYFVTICCQGRESRFGENVTGEMRLNEVGLMVKGVWKEIPAYYAGVAVDDFVVMPNHIHGIILLTNRQSDAVGVGPRADPDAHVEPGRPQGVAPTKMANQQSTTVGVGPRADPDAHVEPGRPSGQPQGVAPTKMALWDVVHRFKSLTTARYRAGVQQCGWPPFPGRLWQRNYYERIIRHDEELNQIRQYIIENPARWSEDAENPSKSGGHK